MVLVGNEKSDDGQNIHKELKDLFKFEFSLLIFINDTSLQSKHFILCLT